jgi:hypothetical protein
MNAAAVGLGQSPVICLASGRGTQRQLNNRRRRQSLDFL